MSGGSGSALAVALTAGVAGVLGVCAVGGCSKGEDAPAVGWKRGHRRGGGKTRSATPVPVVVEQVTDTSDKPLGAVSTLDTNVATEASKVGSGNARWQQLKQDGKAFYDNDELEKAIDMWSSAVKELTSLEGQHGEQLAALHSNCALARNKLRDQLEEESPGAASRLLPLIVLDCNLALSADPTATVRCKALKHRAEALTAIKDEAGLLHAVCDLTTAKKVAAEQATDKKLGTKVKARWKKNEREYGKQKTSAFAKLLAMRLDVWKRRQNQSQVLFDARCQLCGTSCEKPQGTEEQNAPLRVEVYEFPRPVLVSVREHLEVFRPARTLEELQGDSWSINWTTLAKSNEATALQVFKRFQEAAVLTKNAEYSSALPIWELAVRTGASEYEAMVQDGSVRSELAINVAICASDAAFYSGMLYYAQGQKVPRMKKRRTKDAIDAHTYALSLLDKVSLGRTEVSQLPEFKRSRCANLTARGTMMVVDDMRELISQADAGAEKGAASLSGAEAHAAARKDLEAAQILQEWHPDLQLSLARMELEPVTRTQVAMAAAAQQGQQPSADMNAEELQAAVNRAEAYLEKTLAHPKPTLQAYMTAGQHRLSADAEAFEALMLRAEEDYPDNALLASFKGKMYHTLATIAKKKQEQLAQVVPIIQSGQIPKEQLPTLLLQLGVPQGQTLDKAICAAEEDHVVYASKAPSILTVAVELFEKQSGGCHPAYIEAQHFRIQTMTEQKDANTSEAKRTEIREKILGVDPTDKTALMLQFKMLSDQSKGGTPAADNAEQQLLRLTAKLLMITDTFGEAHAFGQKLIDLETAVQLKVRMANANKGDGVWLSVEELRRRAAKPKNAAFLFLKPHAATEATKTLLESELSKKGLTVTMSGQLDGDTIDTKKLIDKHYYSIASKATLLAPANIPGMETHAAKFEKKFGLSWCDALAADKVFNAEGACTKLSVDAIELDQKWAAAKRADKLVKFGGGFYCAELAPDCYVMNGFFMAMRAKYTTTSAKLFYYCVEWDDSACSWDAFRSSVLGPTDPADAPADSLRGLIAARWKELGLSRPCDVGDNAVHASASPFEAMVERCNWLTGRLINDPFGSALIAAGVKEETLKAWATDPQVIPPPTDSGAAQNTSSLFDLLEDLDASVCVERCAAISRANA